MNWTHLAHEKAHWRAIVNMVLKFVFQGREFLIG